MAEAFRLARSHPDLAGAELQIHGHLGFFKTSGRALLDRLAWRTRTTRPRPSAPGCATADRSPRPMWPGLRERRRAVFLAGGGRYVTSGKIFEYMASGHPIVSVHAPGIAAVDVLEGYPLWFNADGLDVEELAASMIAAGKAPAISPRTSGRSPAGTRQVRPRRRAGPLRAAAPRDRRAAPAPE